MFNIHISVHSTAALVRPILYLTYLTSTRNAASPHGRKNKCVMCTTLLLGFGSQTSKPFKSYFKLVPKASGDVKPCSYAILKTEVIIKQSTTADSEISAAVALTAYTFGPLASTCLEYGLFMYSLPEF